MRSYTFPFRSYCLQPVDNKPLAESKIASNSRKGSISSEIIALFALMISSLSLVVSLSSFVADNIYKLLMIRPQLNMEIDDNKVVLSNDGTGSAILYDIRFLFDGQCAKGLTPVERFANFHDSFQRAFFQNLADVAKKSGILDRNFHIRMGMRYASNGQFILSNTQKEILTLDDPYEADLKEIYRSAFFRTALRVDLYYYYCSPIGLNCVRAFPVNHKDCTKV